MVEGLFSFFLFYCGSSINQYAGQRTLTDVFWASLLLLELTYFKTIVLPNHFRMLHVFIENQHFLRRTISLVFCSSFFSILKNRIKGASAQCFFFPYPVFGNLTQREQEFLVWSKFSNYMGFGGYLWFYYGVRTKQTFCSGDWVEYIILAIFAVLIKTE